MKRFLHRIEVLINQIDDLVSFMALIRRDFSILTVINSLIVMLILYLIGDRSDLTFEDSIFIGQILISGSLVLSLIGSFVILFIRQRTQMPVPKDNFEATSTNLADISPKQPPQYAEWLIMLISKSGTAEDRIGDLQEVFKANVKHFGFERAKRLYWSEVIRAVGPLARIIQRLSFAPCNGVVYASYFHFRDVRGALGRRGRVASGRGRGGVRVDGKGSIFGGASPRLLCSQARDASKRAGQNALHGR